MALIFNNQNNTIQLGSDGFMTLDEHTSAPATPASGFVAFYAKADGNLYSLDDAAVEKNLSASTPGGATTEIQFNNAGAFAGDPDFTWILGTNILSVGSLATPGIITGKDGTAAVGAALTVEAGNGDGAGNAGGVITVRGGTATDGDGGNAAVQGGTAVGTSRTGGTLNLTAGNSTTAVTGGVITMTAGAGGPTGVGGTVTISGGSGGTTSGAGGAVTLRAGIAATLGAGGALTLASRDGVGAAQNGGDINITVGAPTTTGTAGRLITTSSGGFELCRNGNFTTAGDAQSGLYVLRVQTTNATATEMFLDGTGGTRRMVLAMDTAWSFDITVVARRTDANDEGAGYQFAGVIDNNAGTTALVGTVLETVLAEDFAAWVVAVTADNTNDALIITVTGELTKTINWVAFVRTVEVTG